MVNFEQSEEVLKSDVFFKTKFGVGLEEKFYEFPSSSST